MMAWLMHHRRALFTTLAHMASTPVASLFTLLAIGVALSLPTGMYVLLENVTRIVGTLPAQIEITLFMRDDASPDDLAKVRQQLQTLPGLSASRFVPKQSALQNIAKQIGITELATELPKNPLPDAWIISPSNTEASSLAQLKTQLTQLPGVALVQADHQWAQRLDALLVLGRTMINILAVILGVALLAISGNTIRLQIITRHAEIEVSRLIGATDRYVRRPFLYFGATQGLLGGIIAWGIVSLSITLLTPQFDTLVNLYASQLQLDNLALIPGAILLATAAALGWLGAYIAVGHTFAHLDNNRG